MSDVNPVPANTDAERSVLAALLIDRDAILQIAPVLTPDDFYDSAHRTIYAAMLRLYQRRVPIDFVTLAAELERPNRDGTTDLIQAGGYESLTLLNMAEVTAVHAPYYAELVRACAGKRALIAAGETLLRSAYDPDISLDQSVAEATAAIAAATERSLDHGYQTMKQLMDRAYERIDQDAERTTPFGLVDLDEQIGGMRDGQLVIVAARPGLGKSSLAMQIVHHNVTQATPVGMISLEMSGDELADRLLALATQANMHDVRTGCAPHRVITQVTTAIGKLAEHEFLVDDRTSGELSTVQARARQMLANGGIRLLIVDYLQLMHVADRRENRVQEVSAISRGLKQLARELGIPVIALAQLNRALESRADPTPVLSDLRESGSIEQDADIVIFIHRPDLYSKDAPPNVAKLMVAKHRNGPHGNVSVLWRPEEVRFESLSNREDSR